MKTGNSGKAPARGGGREPRRNGPHLLSAYGELLKSVWQFKYLGRIVSYDDNDTPAIRRNIKKAWRQRDQFRKVLERESVTPHVAGIFYQAVVASVLLYGSESWVVSPSALRELEGFHVEFVRRLTGMRPQKVNREWVYPTLRTFCWRRTYRPSNTTSRTVATPYTTPSGTALF